MAIVKYTTTEFIKPDIISEAHFWAIKKELNQNPNFKLKFKGVSFIERFGRALIVMVITFGLQAFCFQFFENGNPMIFIGGMSMIFFIGTIFHLFLEVPSFLFYLIEKKIYLKKLKKIIQSSKNYNEFSSVYFS